MTLKVWTCVSALQIIANETDFFKAQKLSGPFSSQQQRVLGHFLAERQLPNGGLNGRPEKLEDVSLHLIIEYIKRTAHQGCCRCAIPGGCFPRYVSWTANIGSTSRH